MRSDEWVKNEHIIKTVAWSHRVSCLQSVLNLETLEEKKKRSEQRWNLETQSTEKTVVNLNSRLLSRMWSSETSDIWLFVLSAS